jgi:hypothetical protein
MGYKDWELLSPIFYPYNEFFHDRRMHYIFGQKECTLDTKALMDEGGMLLVNLSGISRNTARVLGTMLIHDFFIEATNRPEWPDESFPFYVVRKTVGSSH